MEERERENSWCVCVLAGVSVCVGCVDGEGISVASGTDLDVFNRTDVLVETERERERERDGESIERAESLYMSKTTSVCVCVCAMLQ